MLRCQMPTTCCIRLAMCQAIRCRFVEFKVSVVTCPCMYNDVMSWLHHCRGFVNLHCMHCSRLLLCHPVLAGFLPSVLSPEQARCVPLGKYDRHTMNATRTFGNCATLKRAKASRMCKEASGLSKPANMATLGLLFISMAAVGITGWSAADCCKHNALHCMSSGLLQQKF